MTYFLQYLNPYLVMLIINNYLFGGVLYDNQKEGGAYPATGGIG
jgi:hypothetical protein